MDREQTVSKTEMKCERMLMSVGRGTRAHERCHREGGEG